jgi:calcium-dependent protein kinase
MEASEMF